jgi:magnesium chelatase family protein
VRSRVVEARARQAVRLGEGRSNRKMSAREAEECGLHADVVDALNRALPYPHEAGRRIRIARVARTIADLAGAELVDTFHLAEAIEMHRPSPEPARA